MATHKLLYFVAFLLTVNGVRPVSAICGDVNKAVNCSFSSGDSCLDAYNRQDKHGLKWITKSGAIQEGTTTQWLGHNRRHRGSYQNYGRQNSFVQIVQMDASPDSGDYLAMPSTNDSRAWGVWTEIVSPPFTIDNHGCLYFSYHNSVCTNDPLDIFFMVSLRLDENYRIGCENRDDDILLREYPCTKSTNWKTTKLSMVGIFGIYRLVFSALQHGNNKTWMAVDSITYSDQSCSIQDDSDFVDGECDFEDSDLCGYRSSTESENGLQWRVVQREMLNHHEDIQYKAPKSYFLAIWGRADRQQEQLESLYTQSPKVVLLKESCLSLTYYSGRFYRDNKNVTALVVSRVNLNNQSESMLHELPATLGDEPIKAFVPLPQGEYAIRFTAKLLLPFGFSPDDVIGIDDVEVHKDKKCDAIRCNGAVCDDISMQHCNGRGKCLGRGLQHKSCECQWPYIGKHCEFDPTATSRSQSIPQSPFYG